MTFAVPPVGRTALMTAAAREHESRSADPLFDDPWAEALLDVVRRTDPTEQLLGRPGDSELWDFLRAIFVGRTPFFDAEVRDGIAAGATQVVILAAGLDARAARLDLPSHVTVYELDSEPMIRFKEQALAHAGLHTPNRVSLAADLTGDWSALLGAAGHRPDESTVWLAEGLLLYFDRAACTRLGSAVRAASAPGSRFAVEYLGRSLLPGDFVDADATDSATIDRLNALFGDGPSQRPQHWLADLGFVPDRLTDVATELATLGRPIPYALDPARPDPFVVRLASGTVPTTPSP